MCYSVLGKMPQLLGFLVFSLSNGNIVKICLQIEGTFSVFNEKQGIYTCNMSMIIQV